MTIQTLLSPRTITASEGPTYRVVSDLVTFKAIAEDTGGAYSLFETLTPVGQGAPPHRQRFEDEAFFVLDGVYTFLVGDQHVELTAGGYAFVPRETVHAYTNSGTTPARMLILVSPGGIHEQFFAEAGEWIADRARLTQPATPPDLPRLLTTAAKYGIEILTP